MLKRRLGDSELKITPLGLGTWAIGGPWEYGWGEQGDEDSIKTIHRALEKGMNWIDTAPAYGLGHSEKVVARALKQTDNKPYIFTKCGIVWDEQGKPSFRINRPSIEKEIEASLRRLEVDVIDLYQIHWPIKDKDIEEAWTTLTRLKEEGKVRYIGVSNFSVQQMERARKISEITSLQPPYSLLDQNVASAELPYCQEHSIGVINYSPMASGMLTGKMTRERLKNLPRDDWRRKHQFFKEPQLSRNLELVELLKKIASRHETVEGAVATAWTLLNPAVTGAIVGFRKPEQVDEIIDAHTIKLTDSEIQDIDDFMRRNP